MHSLRLCDIGRPMKEALVLGLAFAVVATPALAEQGVDPSSQAPISAPTALPSPSLLDAASDSWTTDSCHALIVKPSKFNFLTTAAYAWLGVSFTNHTDKTVTAVRTYYAVPDAYGGLTLAGFRDDIGTFKPGSTIDHDNLKDNWDRNRVTVAWPYGKSFHCWIGKVRYSDGTTYIRRTMHFGDGTEWNDSGEPVHPVPDPEATQ